MFTFVIQFLGQPKEGIPVFHDGDGLIVEEVDVYFRIFDISPFEFIHDIIVEDIAVDPSVIIEFGFFRFDRYDAVGRPFELEVFFQSHIGIRTQTDSEIYRTFPVVRR